MRFRPLSALLKAGLLALTVGLLGSAAWARIIRARGITAQ
jgi:hypothetical protein